MIKFFVFDIETTLSEFYSFSTGKQVLRHSALIKPHKPTDIISISYMKTGDKKATVLSWGFKGESSKEMLRKFDEVLRKAQDEGYWIFGKNNKSFDEKHVNFLRMYYKLPPLVNWTKYTGDLQVMLKQNFRVLSQSLDWWSTVLGYGGKQHTEFQDWVKIAKLKQYYIYKDLVGGKAARKVMEYEYQQPLKELLLEGNNSLALMIDYNAKDVEDTMNVLLRVAPYIELKNPMISDRPKAKKLKDPSHLSCITCGTKGSLVMNGPRGNYQQLLCKACPPTKEGYPAYGGRVIITKSGKLGGQVV